MKTFIVFAICIVVAQALNDEQKANIKKQTAECISETKVDEQLVEKLTMIEAKTEEEGLKMFVLCMMIKYGVMDKDANFNMEKAVSSATTLETKNEAQKLINACMKKGNTPQQTAWNIFKCITETEPYDQGQPVPRANGAAAQGAKDQEAEADSWRSILIYRGALSAKGASVSDAILLT